MTPFLFTKRIPTDIMNAKPIGIGLSNTKPQGNASDFSHLNLFHWIAQFEAALQFVQDWPTILQGFEQMEQAPHLL